MCACFATCCLAKNAQRFFCILNTLPVRAKVKINRSPILLPLQGVGVYALIPRAPAWAVNWLPFQGAPFRTLFVYHVRMLRHLLFGKKRTEIFLYFEHPTCKGKSKNQSFAHTFALTGRRRLCIDTQGASLGCELAALSGRSFSHFVRLSCAHASPLVVWQKTHRDFSVF